MEYQTTFTLSTQYFEGYRHKFAALFKAIRYIHKGHGHLVRRASLTPPTPPAKTAILVDSAVDVDDGRATATSSQAPSPAHPRPVPRARSIPEPNYLYEADPETNDERRERLSRSLINGDTTLASELLPLLPPDDGHLAIEIITDVRAYWQGMPSHKNPRTIIV